MKPFKRDRVAGGEWGGRQFGGRGAAGRSFGGGSRGFGAGGRGFQNRGADGRVELHQAECAACGRSCEVPFRPNGSKPTYCRDCFKKNGGPERRPFRPSYGADKPRYDAGRAEAGTKAAAANEIRFDEIDIKLDRILRELEALKEARSAE